MDQYNGSTNMEHEQKSLVCRLSAHCSLWANCNKTFIYVETKVRDDNLVNVYGGSDALKSQKLNVPFVCGILGLCRVSCGVYDLRDYSVTHFL